MEEHYFNYSATLRIFGKIENLNEISNLLDLEPTYSHNIGDKRTENSEPRDFAMWMYKPDIPREEPLENHINALWNTIKNSKNKLLELKEKYTVDVFLGYRSYCDNAGIEIPYTCLEMFTELKIPFGISIIIV